MTEKDQIDALSDELDKLINRFCDEFDLARASAVGVLMFKAHTIMRDAEKQGEDGD